MPIEKEDLDEAIQETNIHRDSYGSYVSSFMIYAIASLILSSIITAFLTFALNTIGAVLGLVVNLIIAYYVVQKLFESVDDMVISRIRRREQQILREFDSE